MKEYYPLLILVAVVLAGAGYFAYSRKRRIERDLAEPDFAVNGPDPASNLTAWTGSDGKMYNFLSAEELKKLTTVKV